MRELLPVLMGLLVSPVTLLRADRLARWTGLSALSLLLGTLAAGLNGELTESLAFALLDGAIVMASAGSAGLLMRTGKLVARPAPSGSARGRFDRSRR